ncbi:MAG: hypothetical protein M1829_006820 [Trizodia sp. TS-e1964]|nr:MAG: hypothetical protein M1829_006820 [Trizodia sp. TS-e1964]
MSRQRNTYENEPNQRDHIDPPNIIITKPTEPSASSPPKAQSPLQRLAQSEWMIYSIASGACAACNGVFAKLTTTSLTSHLTAHISSNLFDIDPVYIDYGVRGAFLGLNILFNAIMWYLFTQALRRSSSSISVSLLNSSANFLVTAFFGVLIFAEVLKPLWWLGASLLIAGNLIIGSRDGAAAEAARSDGTSAEEVFLKMQAAEGRGEKSGVAGRKGKRREKGRVVTLEDELRDLIEEISD